MNIPLTAVLVILLVHFFSDFVIQSDKVAKTKSTDNATLLWHVTLYSACMAIFFGFYYALLNGILHFVTDYYSSRVTKKLWAQGRTHEFFEVIGLDQLAHYIALFSTFYVLEGFGKIGGVYG